MRTYHKIMNAPFKMGDKVVCISGTQNVKNKEIYIIRGIFKQSDTWFVELNDRYNVELNGDKLASRFELYTETNHFTEELFIL